jgi:sodium-dependent dicarboxylate transporter 2/3/5
MISGWRWALWIGVAAAAAAGLGARAAGMEPPACWTLAITTLCSIWWMTEAIPIPATSLIPLAVFPLLGVLDSKATAACYGDNLVLMFLGGFMLSAAMEKSGAHLRLAMGMVRLVGVSSGRRVVLGFMIAAAFVSMWVSNAATTMMMMPVVLALLKQARQSERLAAPLLLGIAYASSIGGMATPIGSPPNGVFMGQYARLAGEQHAWTFLQWMKLALPVTLVLLPACWWCLTRAVSGPLDLQMPPLGPMRSEEKRVLALFVAAGLLWVFRTDPAGGWSGWLLGDHAAMISDATVGLLVAMALFLVPGGQGQALLDWKTAESIPWGVLILFGGGLAISQAFEQSGVSRAVGLAMSGLEGMPVPVMVLLVCVVVKILTEVASNTAMATLMMPILHAAATAMKIEPAILMAPAAMTASCAFMLPAGTPPNAIVFSSGLISLRRMAGEGLLISVVSVVVITLLCWRML